MKFLLPKRGFTFVEVLVSLGIIGLLIGLAIPFYQTFYLSSQLDNTTSELIQTLRKAQLKAMASEGDQAFGVRLEQRRFILFRGFYNPSDSYNEITQLPNTLTLTSSVGQDVVFNELKGTTFNIGTITISLSGNRSRKISIINQLGTIDVD